MEIGNKLGYAVSVVVIIGALSTGASLIYTKIAWASDVDAAFTELNQSITDNRKQDIRDKIFEKNFLIQQGTATPLDKALKDRYKLQLEDIKKSGAQ